MNFAQDTIYFIAELLPILYRLIALLFVYKVVRHLMFYYRKKNKVGEITLDQLGESIVELEHRSEWIWKHWKWYVMCCFLLIFWWFCIRLLFDFANLLVLFFQLQQNILPNRMDRVLSLIALKLYVLVIIAAGLFLYSDKRKVYRTYAWRVLLLGFVIFIVWFLISYI